MPKSFIQKVFGRWLSRNRPHFRFQPIIVKVRRKHLRLRFAGISQKVSCTITKSGVVVSVSHHGEFWDIVADFDAVLERRSPEGYYCDLCMPQERRFFATREELLTRHSFDALLEWVNEELSESAWVYLFATKGATWVEIKEKGDIKVDTKYLVHAFPVVERMSNIKTEK